MSKYKIGVTRYVFMGLPITALFAYGLYRHDFMVIVSSLIAGFALSSGAEVES